MATISALGNDAVTAQAGALSQLWRLTFREAQSQSFGDVFLFIMAAFIIATLMVPLMRKIASPKAPSADAH